MNSTYSPQCVMRYSVDGASSFIGDCAFVKASHYVGSITVAILLIAALIGSWMFLKWVLGRLLKVSELENRVDELEELEDE